MNKEGPYRDQAEKLRQRIKPADFEEGQAVDREELPPRSRVHQQKRKKNKWKLKYPVIRLLVLFFILLPITIFSIYSAVAKNKIGDSEPAVGESTDGFEFIDIDNPEENSPDVENSQSTDDGAEEDSGLLETEPSGEEIDASLDQQDADNQSIDKSALIEAGDGSSDSTPKDTVYHTVKPGETIFRISMMYYQSKVGIDTIKATNSLTSNEIRVGQVLIIPFNK
ncbi:LysM peptidoglycan-binding domain-containing protein [Niallia endozanthoxylica]|uniref:LysM peptidoglycan-binding domain-containing protein n=1 Tax=Niallia endozanthoxylica TaxID=2036016 RepID=A0A5J5HUD1_9BACI|nr:LysM peptidoglycan-binding domain-containing protein [Niallia endozanthoxylica]KAA9026159.1 LysM peptidoglycan-binding domain-containing protein [Niallia endozanthoxylica]